MSARFQSQRLRTFLVVLILALGYPYLSSFAVWLGLRQSGGPLVNARIMGGIIFELVILALLAKVLSRQGRSWRSIGLRFSWIELLHALGLFIGGYLAYYVAYVIAWYLSAGITGRPIAVQANNMSFLHEGDLLLLLIYVLVNPWFEELIVRAYTITELAAFGLPEGSIIFLSVLLQTGYHLYQGAAAALLASSLFFVFSLYFAYTRRALPLILAHLCFDLFGLLAAR